MTRAAWAALACLLCACWYKTPEQRQRDWAQAMTPKRFEEHGAVEDAAARYTVRVRALVDQKYVSQNPRWEDRVRSLVGRASTVAQERFGARFELLSVGAWDHPELNALEPLLQQLRTEHPAEDADLVVGFTSSLQL